jgi:tRNA (mo5U34)-methyltransferase
MDDLQSALDQLGPWYQNIEVAPGIWTNPSLPSHPRDRWLAIQPFVGDLSGKTVLDIGCNAGFFAMRMKERGASRVVGIDTDPTVLRQARFLSKRFGLDLELQHRSAYDIVELGHFDIVLCLGVLYHLRHPLLALDNIARICRERLFAQMVLRVSADDFLPAPDYEMTEYAVFDNPAFPRMFFIEQSYDNDSTNWWFATRSCFTAMLRSAGFRDLTDTVVGDTIICTPPGVGQPSKPISVPGTQ